MTSRTRTLLLAALSAVLACIVLWQARSNSADRKLFKSRAASLAQEISELKSRAAVPLIAPAVVATPAPPPRRGEPDTNPRSAATASKLQETLAAARARISELESKVLSLEADRATISQQRQQEIVAGDETCRARIADTQQSLESARADLKAAQQRASLFEAENANLRKAQAAKAVARAPEPSSEVDELSRRRDTHMKSLIRQFREIDNEYRTMLRDPQGTRPNDAAVYRIQSALTQAEDDLRQIDSLNAKTLLVERKAKN